MNEKELETCIACGGMVTREDSRIYDTNLTMGTGNADPDRVCKECHFELNHYTRDGLEDELVEAGAGEVSNREFVHRFMQVSAEHNK